MYIMKQFWKIKGYGMLNYKVLKDVIFAKYIMKWFWKVKSIVYYYYKVLKDALCDKF